MANPAPRSTRVKQPDFITNTLSRASGDSRPSGTHHLFSGSWIASEPILGGQVGISACFCAVLSSTDAAKAGGGTNEVKETRQMDVAIATERAMCMVHPYVVRNPAQDKAEKTD